MFTAGPLFCASGFVLRVGKAPHGCEHSVADKRSGRTFRARCASVVRSQAHDVDIAILGGGPGGLSTAAAIKSALHESTRVKVYESLSNYTLQGSGVLMQPNVQNALDAIQPGLSAKFQSHGLPIAGTQQYDLNGIHTRDIPPEISPEMEALREKYGKPPFFLGWHEIRHLLFELLPEGLVEFNTQMKHYTEDSDGVTLHFDQGAPSVRAKVLVGADGYFSKVRTQCLNDGPPNFVGSVMWRARTGWLPGMQDPVDRPPSRWWRDPHQPGFEGPFAVVFKMGTLEETKDRAWTWVLSAPLDMVQAAGVEFDPEARSIKSIQGEASGKTSAFQNAIKVFAAFPEDLKGIIKATDPSTVTQHGLYMHPLGEEDPMQQPGLPHTLGRQQQATDTHTAAATDAQTAAAQASTDAASGLKAQQESQPQGGSNGIPDSGHIRDEEHGAVKQEGWGRGRVTLLGDAAHATIPNGQGLSLAVEDAVVLAWHLKQQGIGPAALRRYEREQVKRVKAIHTRGADAAPPQDKEELLYKPNFRPLWQTSEEDANAESCIVDFG